jgi:hypothetical protein
MRTFAGCTLYLLAILLTISLVNKGEFSDPSGEYAVKTIPFEVQKSTTSCWGHELWYCSIGEIHKLSSTVCARVNFNLIDCRDSENLRILKQALKEFDGEVGDTYMSGMAELFTLGKIYQKFTYQSPLVCRDVLDIVSPSSSKYQANPVTYLPFHPPSLGQANASTL